MSRLYFGQRYIRSHYYPGDGIHLIAKNYQVGDRIIINGRLVTIMAMTTKSIVVKRYGRECRLPLYAIDQDHARRSGPMGHNPHCFMTIDDIFDMDDNQLFIVGRYDEKLAWLDNCYSLLSSGDVLRVGLANGVVLVGYPPMCISSECKNRKSTIDWYDSVDSEWIEVNKGDSLYSVMGEI